MSGVHATAKIILTVEVDAGNWGDDCGLAQIYQQAGEEALTKLQDAIFQKKTLKARIIGEPRVTAVLVEARGGG